MIDITQSYYVMHFKMHPKKDSLKKGIQKNLDGFDFEN